VEGLHPTADAEKVILWHSSGHGIAPMAYAGGAAFSGNFTAADSAETVYSNPAGMTRLDGRKMTGQGMFIKGFSQFKVQCDRNREAINTFGDLK
jgi:long-subunit fatty acid transport protein